MPANLRSDFSATQTRITELEAYFRERVLNGDEFICRHAAACKASHPGVFYEGQLPHIGHHYDLSRNDRPLRIVVVGQEYGRNPIHVSLAARRDMILNVSGQRRFRKHGKHRARNPHMRGTTSLLRLAFGIGLGTDYESEFLNLQEKRVHIFDAFALINFLLCSAVAVGSPPPDRSFDYERFRGSKSGSSTSTMQRNCAEHFRQALEILEPTVVIAQGKGVRTWLGRCMTVRPTDHPNLGELQIRGRWVTLVSLTHPSARGNHNWGANERKPYLVDVVQPTMALALGRQPAPANSSS